MATLTFKWSGDGIARMHMALEQLEGPKRKKAFMRALNHTGGKTYTRVKRAVATQMNIRTQQLVAKRLRKVSAHPARLEYLITSSGRAFKLDDVKGTRASKAKGVTAHSWGETQHFPHAFRIDLWNNYFQRKGKKRKPVFALWGPNINKQLVKNESAAAFRRVVATKLPPRLEHEIKVITNGVLS